MSKYSLVIFDLDGTLLDTLDDLKNSVNFALRCEGLPERSRDEIRLAVGNGIRRLIELSVPVDTDEDKLNCVFNAFKAHYALHNADNTKPYGDILPMLKQLKQENVKLAILSNKADFAVKTLNERYFDGLFDMTLGEREDIPRKPDPAGIEQVLNSLNVDRKTAVYVGDSDVDILTAENAGVDCISVVWGFRDRDFLIKNGGSVFAKTPSELLNIIRK